MCIAAALAASCTLAACPLLRHASPCRRRLQRNGADVTVLEARERVGGRVHSYQADCFTAPVDLGEPRTSPLAQPRQLLGLLHLMCSAVACTLGQPPGTGQLPRLQRCCSVRAAPAGRSNRERRVRPSCAGASIITGIDPDVEKGLRSDPSAILCRQGG